MPNSIHKVALVIYKIIITYYMVKQGNHLYISSKKKNIFKLYSKLNLLGIVQIELTLYSKDFFYNNESTIKLIFQAFEFLLLLKFNSKILFGSY